MATAVWKQAVESPRVAPLAICVSHKVLELYSKCQCGLGPSPNPWLLSQQPLDQNPDLDEENTLSTLQCETSHAAGADAVFPTVLLLSQGDLWCATQQGKLKQRTRAEHRHCFLLQHGL